MLTPCQRFCKLDKNTYTCVSCFRTMKEIKEWASYTSEKREEITNRCLKKIEQVSSLNQI